LRGKDLEEDGSHGLGSPHEFGLPGPQLRVRRRLGGLRGGRPGLRDAHLRLVPGWDEELEQVPVGIVEVDPCGASERIVRPPVCRVFWIVAEWHAALAEPADCVGEHRFGDPEGNVMRLVGWQPE
jgi:hypothetical protein